MDEWDKFICKGWYVTRDAAARGEPTISAMQLTNVAIVGRDEGILFQHWEHISHHIFVIRECVSSSFGRAGRFPLTIAAMRA